MWCRLGLLRPSSHGRVIYFNTARNIRHADRVCGRRHVSSVEGGGIEANDVLSLNRSRFWELGLATGRWSGTAQWESGPPEELMVIPQKFDAMLSFERGGRVHGSGLHDIPRKGWNPVEFKGSFQVGNTASKATEIRLDKKFVGVRVILCEPGCLNVFHAIHRDNITFAFKARDSISCYLSQPIMNVTPCTAPVSSCECVLWHSSWAKYV